MTTTTIQHQAAMDFLDSSPSPKGKVVMDVGCGDGFAAYQFAARGASKVYANDLMDREDPETDLIPESDFLKDIPFVAMNQRPHYANQIDIVWCHHCLEHQEAPIGFLKELHSLLVISAELRLLVIGGELWLAVPNMRDNLNLSPGHTMAYNMPLLIEHLRRASFNVEHGSFWGNRPVGGHLRVRVKAMSIHEKSRYPEPMQQAFDNSGRCPAEAVHNWKWFDEEKIE